MSQDHAPRASRDGPETTFAVRLARLHYLQHHFPNGHPVLDIEEQLVQMAASELREHVLKAAGTGERGIRRKLEGRIRKESESRLAALVPDPGTRKRIVRRMRKHSLDRIFSGTF